MNSAEFRGLLRRHRDAQRLSQDELGKRADLSYSMISRLESGERDPMPDTIGKLVTGLDLPEASADRLYLSAGYLPPALIGPHEYDATILRAWHCLRRPLDGTDKLAAVIDNAVKLLLPDEPEGNDFTAETEREGTGLTHRAHRAHRDEGEETGAGTG